MGAEVQSYLAKKIMSCTDSKDAFNYAKAYSEVEKAEAERDRITWGAQDQIARTELEQKKVEQEYELGKKKLELEHEKIYNEERIQKKRYESEERAQRYRADCTSRDTWIKVGAFSAGYVIALAADIKGLMLAKDVRTLSQLIRF